MSINKETVLKLLKEQDFKNLFTQELGWENFQEQSIEIPIKDKSYLLEPISHKRGFAVFQHKNTSVKPLDYDIRKKISSYLSKTHYEHIIIFIEGKTQIWQWVKRKTKDSPNAVRAERFISSIDSGERLIQKLDNLYIDFADEDNLTIPDIVNRVSASFDKDKVTKKFYDEFKNYRDDFASQIKGIIDKGEQSWYSSLMLNRLMFIYFIEKKGFLDDGNSDYLQDKLKQISACKGKNQFYGFYKEFLLTLFHNGLSQQIKDRSQEVQKLIGKVPYLNGGLFDVHELETKNENIKIPDGAFKEIFDFFDKYDWHLDDRPLHSDKEINPDVIGHIFEKYINQKQMGAYYTKEDITEYISKNTILPFIFEQAKQKCEVAFRQDGYIWQLLKDNPDRYIYESVKKGSDKEIPADIACGIKEVSKRTKWNEKTPYEYALPTEIWRETIERLTRYQNIKSKLQNGEIQNINDFITDNLNIKQFMEDIIDNSESPDIVKAFYYTIAGHRGEKSNSKEIPPISILDPTCGSGAFLFAALNILEPIYDACIEQMQEYKNDKSGKHKDFEPILNEIKKHKDNRNYFIYKSIILNNLYGVDIMKEAAEIAKLRLFLKLAAESQADFNKPNENYGLESLPDIDFNIRSGNSLIGFATLNEVKEAYNYDPLNKQRRMRFDDDNDKMKQIELAADIVSKTFKKFKEFQMEDDSHNDLIQAKTELKNKLESLNDNLNEFLGKEYGIDKLHIGKYNTWLATHQPFHWFSEFYDVIHNRGGFDV
ncbi:MAG: hypothetical protein LBN20_04175, partial [Endomicrobium sp.]|nr:hypothetical protein [Endomicrobium sp.]